MMGRAIRILFWCFAALYVLALLLFIAGTFGLLGSPSGPLAGIFLIPLGMPWLLLIDRESATGASWLVAVLAPAVTLILLFIWQRYLSRP